MSPCRFDVLMGEFCILRLELWRRCQETDAGGLFKLLVLGQTWRPACAGSGPSSSLDMKYPGPRAYLRHARGGGYAVGTPGSARCIRPDQAAKPSSIESTSRSSPSMISIIEESSTNPNPAEVGEEVSSIYGVYTRTEGAGAGEPVCSD